MRLRRIVRVYASPTIFTVISRPMAFCKQTNYDLARHMLKYIVTEHQLSFV